MARMKFVCDSERCIECNGCVTACKNEYEVPWSGTSNKENAGTVFTAPGWKVGDKTAWASGRS